MATGTTHQSASSLPPHSSLPTASTYEEYIEKKLGKTRSQVRFLDLSSSLLQFGAMLLAGLMVFAVVDHWIAPLSPWARYLTFFGGLAACAYFVATSIVPLAIKRINPLYAAKLIEQATPSLRNSLLNFLFLRSDRSRLQNVVYQALEQRAATDLSHVDLDTTIDRGKLIRVAVVFTAVLFCAALYKVLSPKDPFQTVARVVAPWADIARPSRSQILDVQPGDIDVYYGQSVDVTARLTGIRSGDHPTVIVTPSDTPGSPERFEMSYVEDRHHHLVAISGSGTGMVRDATYRVEVGDAISREYRIRVLPAPTIVVEQIEYQYPPYTGRPNLVVERQGDIRAVEGTRVTVRGSTNQPIRSATLEFDPTTGAGASKPGLRPRIAPLPMRSDGQTASVTIALELAADRLSSKYQTYQLSFVNADGLPSLHPIVHQVAVERDLSPEIEVLQPNKEPIEVAENGTLRIELRAVDPDFGLRRVKLEVASKGQTIHDRVLLEEEAGHSGQFTTTAEISPIALGLRAGDTAVFWCIAEDNRTIYRQGSGIPEPNIERTKNFSFTVTEPERNSKKDDNTKSEKEEKSNKNDKSTNKDDAKEKSDQGGGKEKSNDNGDSSKKEETSKDKGETNPDNNGEGNQEENKEDKQEGDQNNKDARSDSKPDGSKGKQDKKNGGGGAGKPNDRDNDNASDSSGGQSGSNPDTKVNSGADSNAGNNPSDGLAKSSTSKGNGKNKDNGEPADGTGDESSAGERQEPLHDGEVVEKILERMKEEELSKGKSPHHAGGDNVERKDDTSSSQPSRSNDTESSAENPSRQRKGEGATPENAKKRSARPEDQLPKTDRSANDDKREKSPTPKRQPNDPSGRPSTETPNGQPNDAREKNGTAPMPPEKTDGSSEKSKNEERGSQGNGNSTGLEKNGNDPSKPEANPDAKPEVKPEQPTKSTGSEKHPPQPTGGSSGTAPEKQPGPMPTPGENPNSTGDQKSPDSANASDRTPNGGQRSENPSKSQRQDIPDGDPANLEYAKKATDLVVEYLRDQKNNPDQKLLDDLNWTTDDLERFLQRWQELKKASAEDKAATKHEFDEALRSLGLRPDKDRNRRGPTVTDDKHGLSESGTRTQPPAKYRSQFKSFQKGGSLNRP